MNQNFSYDLQVHEKENIGEIYFDCLIDRLWSLKEAPKYHPPDP